MIHKSINKREKGNLDIFCRKMQNSEAREEETNNEITVGRRYLLEIHTSQHGI